MTAPDVETIVVAGEQLFTVRESRTDAPRSMTVTVTLNGRFEWSFQEAGWRPMSFGASSDQPYLWSARELIALPVDERHDPEVISVDEDLMYVFRVDGGWLMVCETSVRRVLGHKETGRIDLDEVVDHVRWHHGALRLIDAAGSQHCVRVQGGQLSLDTA